MAWPGKKRDKLLILSFARRVDEEKRRIRRDMQNQVRFPSMASYYWGGLSEAEPFKLDEHNPDAAPDLQGEIIAWRDWKVTAYGDLTSRNTHAVWRPGPMRAICAFGGQEKDHAAPQSGCACGFYGLHTTDGLQSYNGMNDLFLGASGGNATVRGLFAAWGKIVVHPTGIRSEWAELICLVHPEPTPAVNRAGAYYDVPLFSDEAEAPSYATGKGYGLVPEKMRPEPDAVVDPYAMPAGPRAIIPLHAGRTPSPNPWTPGPSPIRWDLMEPKQDKEKSDG